MTSHSQLDQCLRVDLDDVFKVNISSRQKIEAWFWCPRPDPLQNTGDHHPTGLVRSMGKWYRADAEILGGQHPAWKVKGLGIPASRLLWALLYRSPASTVGGLEWNISTCLRRCWCPQKKLLLHWPVEQRQQAAVAHNISGWRGARQQKHARPRGSRREKKTDCARETLRWGQVKNGDQQSAEGGRGRLYHSDTAGTVEREVRKAEEERRNVEAIAMNHQISWTRWENLKERALPQHETTPNQVSVKVLPAPSNHHAYSELKSATYLTTLNVLTLIPTNQQRLPTTRPVMA